MKGFVKMTEKFRQMNSAVSDLAKFNDLARALEGSEIRVKRTGVLQARKNLAPRLGVTSDAIENYRTRRTKVVPNWLMDRARTVLISALQLEVQNLEHEIQLHKQAGAHPSSDALASAETQVAAVRKLLAGG